MLTLTDPIDIPSSTRCKREFICTMCGKKFIKQASLIDVSDEWADVYYVDCERCGKMAVSFDNISQLPPGE